MTAEYPSAKPRHGDQPEEQPPPPGQGDVEREDPNLKSEDEMAKGKNYPHEMPENRGKFDPATTRGPQHGQGQGG